MEIPSIDERAAVHSALGDPVRLGIIEELASSDRTSVELAAAFDVSSNLLAHHLATLERVGLIERAPSAGDRRRRYVRLRRAVLDQITVTAARVCGPVLFVCTHNSARSQLAAALWHAATGDSASSAGTHPARQVHTEAVAAAERHGLDLSDATPRLLESGDLGAQMVITVCDRAHEELPQPSLRLHWSIADPAAVGTPDAFDTAVDALNERIHALA